jgi:hypothetical protein
MNFTDLFKVSCFQNAKQPIKGSTFKKANPKDNYQGVSVVDLLKKNNVGILTGEVNNLFCVDFDTHKSDFKFDYKNHTIEELTKMTYSQKTASGGYHIVFQYDKDLQQKQNVKTNEICEVDTRGDNGYFLISGSSINDKKYKVINDVQPCKMPLQLKEFLLKNGYGKTDNKTNNKKENTKTNELITNQDKNFYIIDSHLKFILENTKDIFHNIEFWKYTSIMKYLNKKEIWDAFNKTQPKYDEANNEKIWNKVDPSKCNLSLLFPTFFNIDKKEMDLNNEELVLKNKCLTYSSYFKMKHLKNDYIKKFIFINKPKLGYDFFQEDNNYLVKSDTGTGKTTSMKHFLKRKIIPINGSSICGEFYETKKFISIVSRKTLGMEQHAIFNEFGLECKYYEYEEYFTNDDNMIVQIDSIFKLTRNINFNEYYVILDEFESIINYLFTSDTLKTRRCSVMKKFIDLLQNCKNWFGIDADISNKSINFINEFVETKDYKIYNNIYKHNKGVEAYEYIDQNEIIEKIIKSEKFIVCCDSKTQADKLTETLETQYNIKNILKITKETDKYYKFDDYDKIIFSPKIIYGIDSIIERDVFCWYEGQTITPEKMLQQISRARNIKKIHFHFTNKKYCPFNENFEDVLKNNINCVVYGVKKDGDNILSNEFEYDPELEKKYLFLYSKFEYDKLCYNTNKFGHFIKLLDDRGVIIKTNIFYEKINKIKLESPQELEIDDYFNIEQNKRVLDFIGLNKEEVKPHFDLVKSYNFFSRHYNIKKFFFEKGCGLDDEEYKTKIQNKDDFVVNNIKCNNQKLRFLKKLMQIVGNENRILIDSSIIPSQREQEQLFNEYKFIFGSKDTRQFNLEDNFQINKTIKKIYDVIFGKLLNAKKISLKNVKGFIYNIDDINLQSHREIYNKKIHKQMKYNIEQIEDNNKNNCLFIDEENPLDYGIEK